MIKECEILLNNEVVSVVDYDKDLIQMPVIDGHEKGDMVPVKKDGNRYFVVDRNETKKKTTNPGKPEE